ncbi:MAG: hypothetical protein V1907_04760 [Candidatus Kerfeldbacteria bacterium]
MKHGSSSTIIQPVPRQLLRSKYRRTLWKNTQHIINELTRALPASEVYLLGSFTTKKRRPADVDYIVLIKTKVRQNANWSVDIVFAPDNTHGEYVLEDTKKWMKQKYGAKKSSVIRIA